MLKFWLHIHDPAYHNPILATANNELNATNGFWLNSLKKLYDLFNWHWSGHPPTLSDIAKMTSDLHESFKYYWCQKIRCLSKTETLVAIGKKFEPENYITEIKCRKIRSSFAKFRTSSHRLEIETGRHAHIKRPGCRPTPIPRNLRHCMLCKELRITAIGDETHMLLHCPLLLDERKTLISVISNKIHGFSSLEDCEKIRIMLNSDGLMLNAVAKFIHTGLSLKRKPLCPPSDVVLLATT